MGSWAMGHGPSKSMAACKVESKERKHARLPDWLRKGTCDVRHERPFLISTFHLCTPPAWLCIDPDHAAHTLSAEALRLEG